MIAAFNESNNNVPDEGSPISGVVAQPVEFPNIPNNNWTTSSPELPNIAGALEALDEPPALNIQSTKVGFPVLTITFTYASEFQTWPYNRAAIKATFCRLRIWKLKLKVQNRAVKEICSNLF